MEKTSKRRLWITRHRDNKLIAQFMGFPTQTDVIDDRTLAYYIGDVIDANNKNNENDDNVFHPDDMQFHISWDWLMPVIEKIQDKYLENPKLDYEYIDEIRLAVPNIQEVYYLVLKFIKDQNN